MSASVREGLILDTGELVELGSCTNPEFNCLTVDPPFTFSLCPYCRLQLAKFYYQYCEDESDYEEED